MNRWVAALCAILVLAGCSPRDEQPPAVEPTAALDGSYVVEYDGVGTRNGAPALGLNTGKSGWVFRTACDEDGCVATGGAVADPANPGAPLENPQVADYVDGSWVMVTMRENAVTCTGSHGEEFRADGWVIWDIAIAPDKSLHPTVTTVGAGDCPSVSVVTPTMTRLGDPVPEFPAPDPAQQPARQVPAAAAFHGPYTLTKTRRGQDGEPEVADRDVATYCLRTGDRCVTAVSTPGEPGKPFAHLSIFKFADGSFVRSTVPLPSPCADGMVGVASEVQTLHLPADSSSNPLRELTGELVRTFTAGCPGVEEYDIAYAQRPA